MGFNWVIIDFWCTKCFSYLQRNNHVIKQIKNILIILFSKMKTKEWNYCREIFSQENKLNCD